VKDLSPDIDETQAVSMFVATRLAAPPADTVANLPLVELPAAISTDRMAIMLSGDGGWRDIDKTVADDLQSRGVSVVGWDCLRYFWHSKTPDDVAHDLAAVIETYSARWHPKHIALIGYSFGADVLPFAFNRLPEALRSKITLMSLLAFSKSADFEISVTGWLGAPPTAAALPVADEVNHVPASLVQCFYGETEDDSDCPDLASRGMEVIRTQGGHHFDRNYEALTDRIMSGLTRRGG
jgi:type IV secretory pathway VirJ component